MSAEVKMLEDGKKLQITIDVNDPPKMSKSGKCLLVASEMIKTDICIGGQVLKVGVNAMLKRV